MTLVPLLDSLKFDEKGLIPTIVQDADNHEVLMFAFMNRESVEQTLKTGLATYYSRSRQKLWVKGESSGHTQVVKAVYFDCDHDCLLIQIEQKVAACHTGFRSCFFNKIENNQVITVGTKHFEEKEVYGAS